MKKVIIAIGIGMLLGTTSAVAAEPAGAGALESQYGAWTPVIEGQEFEIASIRLKTTATLGCDGSFDADILGNLSVDIEGMLDQLKNQAAGLTINYIMYSNPTLAHMMEFLNMDLDEALNQMIPTCQSVREFAQSEAADEAVEQCINDKKDPKKCVMASDLEDAAEDVVADRKSAINDWARDRGIEPPEARAGSDNAPGFADIALSLVEKMDQQAENAGEQKEGLKSFVDFARAMNIARTTANKQGEVEQAGREMTLQEYLSERQKAFAGMISAYVFGQAGTASQQEEARGREDYQKFISYKNWGYFPDLTPLASRKLVEAYRTNPQTYSSAVGVWAREVAVSSVRIDLARLRSLYLEAGTTLTDDHVVAKDKEHAFETLDLIEAELALYIKQTEEMERISRITRSIENLGVN